MTDDRVFVITGGASDFLGRSCAELLIRAGKEVIVIDNATNEAFGFIPDAEIIHLSIDNRLLEEKLGGLENRMNVIHCQTQSSCEPDLLKNSERNLVEQLVFLRLCQKLQAQKVTACLDAELLFANPLELPVTETDRESPGNLAGVNHLVIESHLPILSLPWASIRSSTLYGPGQREGVVPLVFSKLELNEPLDDFSPRTSTKDLIHANDAAAGTIAVAINGHGIYNISTGKETQLSALIKVMRKINGSPSTITETKKREIIYQRSCFSPNKANRDLGWQPIVSLKEGIESTAAWLQDNSIS